MVNTDQPTNVENELVKKCKYCPHGMVKVALEIG
jgi:hypothetical protein